MHVMMYVPRSQCSNCIITECMLIDVCFVMHVMQEPQGEQCCALMGYSGDSSVFQTRVVKKKNQNFIK